MVGRAWRRVLSLSQRRWHAVTRELQGTDDIGPPSGLRKRREDPPEQWTRAPRSGQRQVCLTAPPLTRFSGSDVAQTLQTATSQLTGFVKGEPARRVSRGTCEHSEPMRSVRLRPLRASATDSLFRSVMRADHLPHRRTDLPSNSWEPTCEPRLEKAAETERSTKAFV
jgi:hypothetical protein